MPGKLLKRTHYDLVDEDSKVPVHTEEAFEHGIRFKAKYIGTKDIAKPTSRSEIVTAMRRIRYGCKVQGIKKEKVEVQISIDGLRVVKKFHKKKQDVEREISNYPVHRVFYVSHDSQDLQIFSYIAKDGDTFKCFVFKANSKSLAMHIVRSVGQAFEVCHKRNLDINQKEQSPKSKEPNNIDEKQPASELSTAVNNEEDSKVTDEDGNEQRSSKETEHESSQNAEGETQTQQVTHAVGDVSFWTMDAMSPSNSLTQTTVGPVNIEQLQKIYQQQLEQQRQETQAALLQANTFRQQLEIQTQARAESQSQLEAALKQNKELIATVQYLLNQVLNSQQGSIHSPSNLNDLNKINLPPSTYQLQSSTPSAHYTTAGTGTKTDPQVPAIPPPPNYPNLAASLESRNATPSHVPLANGVETPLVDLKDGEMVEPRRVDALPHQFLQFAFDQSTGSDHLDTVSHPSMTSLASEQSQSANDVQRNLAEKSNFKGTSLGNSIQNGKNSFNGTS